MRVLFLTLQLLHIPLCLDLDPSEPTGKPAEDCVPGGHGSRKAILPQEASTA